MLEGLERARALDYRLVALVGDLPYYARAGFKPAPLGRIVLPGPVIWPQPTCWLAPEALNAYCGLVQGIGTALQSK